ncbi:MAG: hypothetical protein ABI448_07305, partial [Bacteroidia bacterium]
MIRIYIFIFFIALIFSSCVDEVKTTPEISPKKDTLVYLNHSDTARYVGINTCKLCHQSIYNTFIETGMGKSFAGATKKKSAGDYKHSVIYDKFSDFYYKSFWGKNDSLYFLEFRLQ